MIDHLGELAEQVRNHTIRLLDDTPNEWLLWAPAGTSNHILWHAGHSLWVNDLLCIQRLTDHSELPDAWTESFGADCRPVRETVEWPGRTEVREMLERQLDRLLELFCENQDALSDRETAARVIHGLHDEARHQGEMYLLLKLRRVGTR